jgi:S-methylmethionine-dependent homocysteine/selenocysteine methylase
MSQYRQHLPQLEGRLFLTDGGIETCLIFHDGFELPYFAVFDLLRRPEGRAALKAYYERYLAIATADEVGFILESPTWRASADWADKLWLSADELIAANSAAIELMAELRAVHETETTPIVVSGCVGPRGDGYDPGQVMSPEEAADYHADQVCVFAEAGADMATAITMTNVNEAVGVTRAAQAAGLPVVISFTLETDGKLPTGETLAHAIEAVDAATGRAPAYFMINCAHPTHFAHALEDGAAWMSRVRGLRANASRRSHQELDEAPDLDVGNPVELPPHQRARRLLRHRPSPRAGNLHRLPGAAPGGGVAAGSLWCGLRECKPPFWLAECRSGTLSSAQYAFCYCALRQPTL